MRMAEENTNAKDILIALYNRNEQYHDSKDKAMWLAASVYLGFTVGLMVWLLENECLWKGRKVFFTIFLSIVFLLVGAFIFFQNLEKCRSVRKAELFDCLIKELGKRKRKELTYKDLVRLAGKPSLPRGSFCKRGLFGLIILIILVLFFFAQIYLLYLH